MTSKQAFIIGFLDRLISGGKTASEIVEIVKTAADRVKQGDLLSGLARTAISDIAVPGAALAMAAPWGLGAVGGHLLGRATDIGTTDVKNVRDEELLQSLQHETDNLKRVKALRDYHQSRRRVGMRF